MSGRLVQDWSGAYHLPSRERSASDAATPAALRLSIIGRLEGLPAETQIALKAASVERLGPTFMHYEERPDGTLTPAIAMPIGDQAFSAAFENGFLATTFRSCWYTSVLIGV